MKKPNKSLYILTLITIVLVLSVSLTGLFYNPVYAFRINRITPYELMGQDAVTSIIALCFLFIILFMDFEKIKTRIIWLGCLMYVFYVYAYYSFSGISSVFYLVYLALTCLSFYLFIFTIIDIVKRGALPIVTGGYPRKSLSVFFFVCILIVAMMEIREIATKTIMNNEGINPYYVFYVLDLAIVFPMIVIVSVLNLKRINWGYLLSGVALIKIITILPAVIVNDVFYRLQTGKFIDFPFDIIALVITMSALVFLFFYMKGIKEGQSALPNDKDFWRTGANISEMVNYERAK